MIVDPLSCDVSASHISNLSKKAGPKHLRLRIELAILIYIAQISLHISVISMVSIGVSIMWGLIHYISVSSFLPQSESKIGDKAKVSCLYTA